VPIHRSALLPSQPRALAASPASRRHRLPACPARPCSGLGQGEAASEQLLVLAPRAAIQQLAAAVAAASPSPPSSDGEGPAPCWRVALQGWNQGAASSGVCLESWRMLTPALQRGLAG
jgi:hypothetical protein